MRNAACTETQQNFKPILSTKMADNQHFQYINKLPYFKEIYGKSKLWLKAYSYTRKGHWTWSTKMAAMSFKI